MWSLYTGGLYMQDHTREQANVVLIHRWSLYAGSIAWKVYSWGTVKCGLCKHVVFMYMWTLEQVGLYFSYYHKAGHVLLSCLLPD